MKEKKTRKQIADMIKARIAVGGVEVLVNKDDTVGWYPQVLVAPGQAHSFQVFAEHVATELRARYELAE